MQPKNRFDWSSSRKCTGMMAGATGLGRMAAWAAILILAAALALGCRHVSGAQGGAEAKAPETALVVKLIGNNQAQMAVDVWVDDVKAGALDTGTIVAPDEKGSAELCHYFQAPSQPYVVKLAMRTSSGTSSVGVGLQQTYNMDGEPGSTDYLVVTAGGRDSDKIRVGTFKVKAPGAGILAENAKNGVCTPWGEIRENAENYAIRAGLEEDLFHTTLVRAKAGDLDAQLQLAKIFIQGNGVERDPAQALEWAEKAAEAGHVPAQLLLSSGSTKGVLGKQDYDAAFKWAKRAADQDDMKGMALMGTYYQQGIGVPKDPATAVEWYKKAANKGHMIATILVGEAYYKGNGVEKDLEEAFQWRLKAAYGGSPSAANTVGQMYFRGEGVPKDYEKALTWLRWAGERGNGNSCATLGLMYFQGLGVEKDPAKAVEWFNLGASKGNALCMSNLGNCYLGGIGVEQDLAKAKQWLAMAGQRGHVRAINKLALLFLQEKDPVRAKQWAAISAKAGNLSGIYLLGLALAQAGDFEQSIKLLEVAAQKGHPNASDSQEKIRTLMEGGAASEVAPPDELPEASFFEEGGTDGHQQ